MNDSAPESAIYRIRLYVDYPYTSPDALVVDSDLVRITAQDLADLVAERDRLAATVKTLQDLDAISVETVQQLTARAEKAEAEVAHLKEALGTAAEIAGDAFWNLPIPKHWDRDEAEYSSWCSYQSTRIKSKIQNLQDKPYV